MRPPSSSSALNEDRSNKKEEEKKKKKKKKKQIKSKASKDRLRHSSLPSYSSSDSEDSYRPRRKMSKSKKKRKELKKSERKRSRRKRSRRDSSSDDSSRGCSTCFSDSDRSRSPVRKSKSRKSERGRSRRKTRYRSPSCSTCSGTRSRSISRSPSPIKERLGSNRRRSPIEERLRSSRDRIEERLANDRQQGAIEERLGSGGQQGRQSPIEERYKEMGEAKRLQSVLAATKSFNKDEDKAIETYDDNTSFQRNEIYDEERGLEVGDREKGSYDAQIIEEDDRWQPSKDPDDDDGDGYVVCESEPSKDHLVIKESEGVGEDEGRPDDDLERILRQKALENLKKLRGGLPAKIESIVDKTNETSIHESYRDGEMCIQLQALPTESRARSVANTPSKKDNGNTMQGISNDSVGFRSVASSITAQNTPNHLKRAQITKISSDEASLVKDNQNKRVPHSGRGKVNGAEVAVADSSASSLVKNSQNKRVPPSGSGRGKFNGAEVAVADSSASSLVKDNQNKRVPPPGSGRGKVNVAEVAVADSSVSGTASAASTENKNCALDEPAAESASGSQFEEKTFSRMRDGEMVQVSYKVYIPKKTPALARRQLQR